MTSGYTRVRSDGRHEVADHKDANAAHGCQRNDWCILTNGHDGECDEDREVWTGPDELYNLATSRLAIEWERD